MTMTLKPGKSTRNAMTAQTAVTTNCQSPPRVSGSDINREDSMTIGKLMYQSYRQKEYVNAHYNRILLEVVKEAKTMEALKDFIADNRVSYVVAEELVSLWRSLK